MKIIFFIAILLLSAVARADAPADQTPPAAAPQVDPALCRGLVEYKEAPGVEYQPGVDVHGKPVAPADLPGQPQMQLPKTLDIPLTLSLAKVLNLNTTQYPASQLGPGTEIQLGKLTLDGDKVSFNGQPLTDDQQAKLADLCQKQGYTSHSSVEMH